MNNGTTSGRENNVLFYSGHCQYCRELMDYITKRDLRPYFVFICVDGGKVRLPPQVDRVPALMLRKERQLLFEEEIYQFIGVPDQEDVAPVEQPTSAYSETFAFIDDNNATGIAPVAGSKNFALFGHEEHINTPEDDGSGGVRSKSGTDSSGVLDRYMSQRAKDITSIFGSQKMAS